MFGREVAPLPLQIDVLPPLPPPLMPPPSPHVPSQLPLPLTIPPIPLISTAPSLSPSSLVSDESEEDDNLVV